MKLFIFLLFHAFTFAFINESEIAVRNNDKITLTITPNSDNPSNYDVIIILNANTALPSGNSVGVACVDTELITHTPLENKPDLKTFAFSIRTISPNTNLEGSIYSIFSFSSIYI